MPDEVFGVPLHPLVIHAVVVLVPLASLGALLCLVPAFARRFSPIVALVGVVAVPATYVAAESGEKFQIAISNSDASQEELQRMGEHAELGDTLLPWVIVLAVGLVAVAVIGAQIARRVKTPALVGGPDDETAPTAVPTGLVVARWVAVAVAIVGAVVATYLVIRIGHLGAEAAWTRVTSGG